MVLKSEVVIGEYFLLWAGTAWRLGPGLEEGVAVRGRVPRAEAGGGDVVGGSSCLGRGRACGGGAERRGRCWRARGLGPRRRAALTASRSRPPAPSAPGADPAGPGAMSPGLLLLGSAVLLAFGLCCTFVHRARSRYEHIPGPPRPR